MLAVLGASTVALTPQQNTSGLGLGNCREGAGLEEYTGNNGDRVDEAERQGRRLAFMLMTCLLLYCGSCCQIRMSESA